MQTAAALLLGALQGLTEFLPVSSSGHLALARSLLPAGALASPGILFEVVVHLGTLAAALAYLRREVASVARSLFPSAGSTGDAARAHRRLLGLLLVAAAPAGAAGVLLAGPVRSAFAGPEIASLGLLATGTVLLGSRRLVERGRAAGGGAPTSGAAGAADAAPKSAGDALRIGLAQAAAILPGVSRSGMTIVAGRLRGMSGDAAARFSFLLSAPVIAGAAVVEGASAFSGGSPAGTGATGLVALELALGFAAAFLFGSAALRWVFRWLARERFHQFGWYCLSLGGIGVGLSGA